MSEVEELEARIRNLPGQDFEKLRELFHELENERWDRQISSDYKAGKFQGLIDKARGELAEGKARAL